MDDALFPPAHKKSWNDVRSEMGGEKPDSTQDMESARLASKTEPGDGLVKRTSARDGSKKESKKGINGRIFTPLFLEQQKFRSSGIDGSGNDWTEVLLNAAAVQEVKSRQH
jgi:hypothetical protein